MSPTSKYWLMKAEPDSRVVKGKDVKFSVDDFEAAGITAWEGVRNHEAKNIMKSMKVGDKILFYHSNCKTPGIAGFAEVCKEAYPDHTAWDPKHPYFDPKSDEKEPKWYMVDAKFISRAPNFVPLALLKSIAGGAPKPPEEIGYIGKEGVKAIKRMALVNRGRLSVQPVEKETWDVVNMLAEKGGWGDAALGKSAAGRAKTTMAEKKFKSKKLEQGEKSEEDEGEEDQAANEEPKGETESAAVAGSRGKKRKASPDVASLRRSTRARK